MGNCYLITSGNQSSAHGPTSTTMDIYNIIISFNRKVFTMACLGLAPQRSWRSGLKYLAFLHPLSPIPFYFCIHTHPSPTYFPSAVSSHYSHSLLLSSYSISILLSALLRSFPIYQTSQSTSFQLSPLPLLFQFPITYPSTYSLIISSLHSSHYSHSLLSISTSPRLLSISFTSPSLISSHSIPTLHRFPSPSPLPPSKSSPSPLLTTPYQQLLSGGVIS